MKSKLGLHALKQHPDLFQLGDQGVRLFKVVDELGLAGDLRAKYPDAVIIGFISSGLRLEDHSKPEELAARLFAEQGEKIQNTPAVNYWEGLNEPNVDSPARMSLLARFERKRIELMAGINKKCALCSFSVGTPGTDATFWVNMIPVLHYGITKGAILALHEYSWPTMRWMTGAYQTDPTEDAGDEGWTTLRYRKVKRLFLKDVNIPFVITEFGVDPGVRPLPFDGGGFFQNEGYRNGINQFEGSVQEPNSYYARDLWWYVLELEKDPYMIGATLFTVGHTGPWADADVADTPVVDILGDYLTGKRAFVPYPPRRPALTGNLFDNPRFDKLDDRGAGYYRWNDPEQGNRPVPEINIPHGWKFWYQHDTTIRLEHQDTMFFQPEVVWWTKTQAAIKEQWVLFRRGAAIIKAFGGWKPIWFKFWQEKTLQAGKKYRVTVRAFPDSVSDYKDGEKIYATDPIAVEHRVIIDDDNSAWLDGRTVTIGQWNEFSREFTSNGKQQRIGFEVRGRWGLKNNGWFFDEATLTPVSVIVDPPPVDPPDDDPPIDPPDDPPIDPPPIDLEPVSNLTLTQAELDDLSALWSRLGNMLDRLRYHKP